MAIEADMVLRDARVIDPASGLDEVIDVALLEGTIVEVGHDLRNTHLLAATTDLRGTVLVPGLIDLHCHVFAGLGDFCIEPDRAGVQTGVPVVVDGGTSGVATFELARRSIEHGKPATKVLAFLDPNQLYLATEDFICHRLHVADDERNLDLEAAEAMVEANEDMIVGFEVRATYTGDPSRSPFLDGTKSIAGDRPIMVSLDRVPHTPTLDTPTLLDALRPGDLVTHAFGGSAGQLLGGTNEAANCLAAAIDKGIRLDVGHAGTDFRFDTARRLLDAGHLPDTISTNLSAANESGLLRSLTDTMSKMRALGVSLPDVVAMCTANAAVSLRRTDSLGAIAPGRAADLTVLRIEDGPVELSDGRETLVADSVVVPVGCFRDGVWIDAGVRVGAAA